MDIVGSIGVAVVFLLIVLPALLGLILVATIGRRAGARRATLVAVVLFGAYALSPFPRAAATAVYLTIPEARLPILRGDLLLSRLQREAIVGMAGRGELPADGRGRLVLPWWASGLGADGTVLLSRDRCGRRVWFGVASGWVYADPGCAPERMDIGSGVEVRDFGNGWLWIFPP